MATKTLITTFGQRKIAQALANKDTIEVTAMVFGDGDGSQYTATVTQTQLKNQLYSTAAIAKVEDETWTYFEATIPESVSNFTIREIGLTCINDDTGQNELIIIATVPDTEKVVSENGVLQTMPVRIGVTTSIGTVITIVADPDSIPPFTNNNLGLIKGKNSDGYVQAKDGNTGFGSVVGWNNVFKKVSSTPQTVNSNVIISLGNTLYYRDSNNTQRTIFTTSSNTIQIGNNNNLLILQGSNLKSSSSGFEIKLGNLYINKSNPVLELRNSDEVAGVTPSEQLNKTVRFNDSKGATVGYLQNQYQANGSRFMVMNCRNADGSDSASISIGYDSNGIARSTTINPPDSSDNNSIATTSFVRKWAYGNIILKTGIIIDESGTYGNPISLGETETPLLYNFKTQPSENPYLPNDNNCYEVYLSIECYSDESAAGYYVDIAFNTSLLNQNAFACKARTVVNNQRCLASWCGWVPLGSDGRLYISRSTNWHGTMNALKAVAYRRLNQ